MRNASLAASCVTLIALTACQRPATQGPQTVRAPVTPTALDAAIGTPRAPGLWEQRVSDGSVVQVSRVCLDTATDRQAALSGRSLNEAQCSAHSVTRAADGWHVATACDMGSAGQVTTTGLATGDFAHHYQIRFESETHGASAGQPNGRRRLVVEATWQGPCPAGMAPGQMDLSDGRRVSMSDILPGSVLPVPTTPTTTTPNPPPPAPAASPSRPAPPALRH
jgi:hypothetical protein